VLACILAINFACAGAAPPDPPHFDPVAIRLELLRDSWKSIWAIEELIQQVNGVARRSPTRAKECEELNRQFIELQRNELRFCYDQVCDLASEWGFHVWFRLRGYQWRNDR
jgi:hypothetical protein